MKTKMLRASMPRSWISFRLRFRNKMNAPISNRLIRAADGFLRHPFTLLIVGFLLTGVIGALFSEWRDFKNHERDNVEMEIKEGEAAILQMSVLYTEFSIRAQLLIRGIETPTSEIEISDRKRLYDEAIVKLETAHLGFGDRIKRIYPDLAISESAVSVDKSSMSELFGRLEYAVRDVDQCIEDVYDSRHVSQSTVSMECEKNKKSFPEKVTAIDAVTRLQKCANILFVMARRDLKIASSTSDNVNRQLAVNLMFDTYVALAGCPVALRND